jgi:hypothetical protein
MRLRSALVTAAAAGGLALMASAASAATLPVQSAPSFAVPLVVDGAAVELISHRHWNRWRHGPRYRYRRPGFRHYHGGWWYRSPWWGLGITVPLVPPLVAAPLPAYGGSHVAWCEARYRSYNPATDQYLGYDGYYHYCNSPYR